MEDNKIDINSLIGFFLIGLIFIGWLYLNPPPPSPEVVQTVEQNDVPDEKPVEQDLSDILSESKIALHISYLIHANFLNSSVPNNAKSEE